MKIHRRTPFGDRYLARKIAAVAAANADRSAACARILGLLHQALGESVRLGLYAFSGGKFRLRMTHCGEAAPTGPLRRRLSPGTLAGADGPADGRDFRIPLRAMDGTPTGLLRVQDARATQPSRNDLDLLAKAADALGPIVLKIAAPVGAPSAPAKKIADSALRPARRSRQTA